MMSASAYFSDSSDLSLSHPPLATTKSMATTSRAPKKEDPEVLILSSDDDARKVSAGPSIAKSKAKGGGKKQRSNSSSEEMDDKKPTVNLPPRILKGTSTAPSSSYHASSDDSSLDIVGGEGKGPVLEKKAISVDESDDEVSHLRVPPTNEKRPIYAPQTSYGFDDSSSDDDYLLQSGGCTFSQQSTGSRSAAIATKVSSADAPSTKQTRRKKPALDRVSRRDAEKRAKAEEKARQKRLRQESKEAEKTAKAEERARQKRLRHEAKEEERARKQSARTMAKQRMGKFATEEVLVLVEPSFYQSVRSKQVLEQLKETYRVMEYPGHARGLIQFVRQDFVAGGARGAQDALEDNRQRKGCDFELQNRVVVVFEDPAVFLKLLDRSDVDDDYPKLEDWVLDLQLSWKTQWSIAQDPTVILLLPGVMDEVARQWNSHRTHRRSQPPPSDTEVKDAIVWMLIQCRVELVPLSHDYTETLNFLLKMTRALSEAPYNQQATELECIKKEKSGLLYPAIATESEKARDTWIRMLRSIPRMSEGRAAHLASYYPTARSLWEAYQDPTKTEGEKKALVACLIDEGRCQMKISTIIYKIMSCRDVDEMLL